MDSLPLTGSCSRTDRRLSVFLEYLGRGSLTEVRFQGHV